MQLSAPLGALLTLSEDAEWTGDGQPVGSSGPRLTPHFYLLVVVLMLSTYCLFPETFSSAAVAAGPPTHLREDRVTP